MSRYLKSVSLFLLIFIIIIVNNSGFIYGDTGQKEESQNYPKPPDISAGAAILMDADTGAILYEKDAYSNYYPASITKIMTCLLAIENLSLDQKITFTDDVFAALPWDAALLGVARGEILTVKDCLYGLMLRSGNEVAVALAKAVSGSEEEFAKLMTERAKEMGALNTVFTNASGLHQTSHYTTAYDMAVIVKEAIKNGTFSQVWGRETYEMSATNMCEAYGITNRHNMLVSGTAEYYQYAEGGKTGYEEAAGRTLVTHAKKDGLSLIAVILFDGVDEAYIDTEGLLDYGFSNFKKVRVSQEENRFGNGKFVSLTDTDYVTIPKYMKVYDLEYETIYNKDNSDGNIVQIKYYFDKHYLGESTLSFSHDDKDDGIFTPVKKSDSEGKQRGKLYIDIGYIMAGIVAVIAIIIMFIYLGKTKKERKIKRGRKKLFKETGRKYKIKKRRRY